MTDRVPCRFCGELTLTMPELITNQCDECWEVVSRVDAFARTKAGKERLRLALTVETDDVPNP